MSWSGDAAIDVRPERLSVTSEGHVVGGGGQLVVEVVVYGK